MIRGFLALSDESIARAAGPRPATYDDVEASHPRPELARILRESRRDARAGGILLALGFGLQLLALIIRG